MTEEERPAMPVSRESPEDARDDFRIKTSNAWIEDFTIELTPEEIHRHVREIRAEAIYEGTGVAAALWIIAAAAIGGALGGLGVSYALWSSILLGFAVLAAASAFGWLLHVLTARLFGRAIRFLAVWNCFVGFMIGLCAIWGGQLEAGGWAYFVSGGLTFLLSSIYRGPDPPGIPRPQVWELISVFAPLAAVVATYIYRNLLPADEAASAAQCGALAAALFIIPTIIMLFSLWDNRPGYRRLALFHLHNDANAREAVRCLDEAMKGAPEDAELYNLRAFAWARAGDAERAEADWQNVARLKPRSGAPFVLRGVDALRRGDPDAAIPLLETAVKRRPKQAVPLIALALAYERRGDLDHAIGLHERAAELAEDARASTNLAAALLAAGRYEDAIGECRVAQDELDSVFAKTWLIRARANAALGLTKRAVEYYRMAADTGGEVGVTEEAEQALAELGDQPD